MPICVYKTDIESSTQIIWEALWEDSNYRYWTALFTEGSHMVADWKIGGKVHFLGPDGNGMFSVISELVTHRKIVFTHLGEIKNWKEQAAQNSSHDWSGAQETYELQNLGSYTTLLVHVDMPQEHIAYFDGIFPQALERVKELVFKIMDKK